jgi:molybdopterin synthase sulfur carrier subunit
MKVNFYATLREITGKKSVDFDLADGVTVREMLEEVFKQYPLLRKKMMTAENELHAYVHVFVNGRDAPYLADVLETHISSADKLDIFPAVGGG